MIAVQVAHYADAGEEITEVVAVTKMTPNEFNALAEECDVYDDGGSHTLIEYSKNLLEKLIAVDATNIEKLRDAVLHRVEVILCEKMDIDTELEDIAIFLKSIKHR